MTLRQARRQIERGLVERGVLENTGRKNLVTFNVYIPPAYDPRGEPLR
jgi:hypothetical protein